MIRLLVENWHLFKNNFQNVECDLETKNIRLTELMVDLRDAILHICRYFTESDESFKRVVNLQVYSISTKLLHHIFPLSHC